MQLIDYIISSYNVLDYTALLSCYKSYEGMLEAFANTKGAEYDLKEVAHRTVSQGGVWYRKA